MMNGMNGVNSLYSSQFYPNPSNAAMSAYLNHPSMQHAAAAVAACSGQPMGVASGMNLKYDMKYDVQDGLRRPVPYVFPGNYLRD